MAKRIALKTAFKIENIVASAALGAELDLYAIAKASADVDYEPEQFPGAIYKIKEPKVALLLFKNGKIICTGAKTEADIKRAIDMVIKVVRKYILSENKSAKRIKLHTEFKIENIVASADLGAELDLYAIAKASVDVDYEPEQFPGAIYKIKEPKVALLLFKNGKIICTGAKTEADIKKAIDQVIKVVKNYILNREK
jgi:transcription initiation factor TFIID TATA-box-binding protein